MIIAIGCQQNSQTSNTSTKKQDSIRIIETKPLFDTTGLFNAPIKILKTTVQSKEIDVVDNPEDNLHHEGHFKRFITIKVKYKNVSSKRIIGARLNWVVVDKDNTPAELGIIKTGLQYGVLGTCEPITDPDRTSFSFGIGQTKTDEWQYVSKNGAKVKVAFPSEVQFYDNSKWKIGGK